MHTTHELSAASFEYRRDGESVARTEVLPRMAIADRLGVVMADPADGLGAGNFVLSCVTAFYDRLRARDEEFFEYPDYYTFQAAADPLDYLEFDVWPDHKNVPVPPDPEGLLRAVNDRAVNVLLVPATPGPAPDLEDVTRRSAERRIDACFQYAPDGRLEAPDFTIEVPRAAVRDWYRDTVEAAGIEPLSYTPSAADGTTVSQQFRAVDLEPALRCLPSEG
jgi:hypothetical protein